MFSHNRPSGYGRSKWVIISAGAAGLVAAGIVGAGSASAGQAQDDQYFEAVQRIFPALNLDRAAVISNAHLTCDNLSHGYTFDQQVAGYMKADPGKTLAQAQAETNAAISIYCPQYK